MENDPGGTRDADIPGTLRGILILLVAGLALGFAYNAIGRASRPPRGLEWVKRPDVVLSLDSLQAALAPHPPGSVAAPDSAPPGALPAPGPTASAGESPPPSPPGARPAPDPTPSAVPDATPPASSPVAAPAPAGDLPVIPDVDRPIQVELATLKRLHDAGAVLVVDARTSYEYEDGHIAGAISLPYAEALADPSRLARLGEAGRPIAVYCSGGGCELSIELARLMLEHGRKRVLVYEGGWPEWVSYEYPTARGAQPGGR